MENENIKIYVKGFSKSGLKSYSLIIPKKFLYELEISPEKDQMKIRLENKKIIIEKWEDDA